MLSILEYIDIIFVSIVFIVLVILFFLRLKSKPTPREVIIYKSELLSHWAGRWGGFIAAVVILVSGWLIAMNTGINKETEMKRLLRNQTVDLSRSFHPEHIDSLSFKSTDSSSVFYKRLSKQIRWYAEYSGLSGIYTLVKSGDDYYFGPESFEPGDSDHSPPGSRYPRPPEVLDQVFSEQVALVYGPFDDEFGRYVSCFSPVLSIDGEEVLMIVGVDISAEEWIYHSNIVKVLPLSVTLILLSFVLFGFILVQNRKNQRGFLSEKTFHYKEALLIFFAGIVISFYAGKNAYEERFRYQHSVFSLAASAEGTNVSRSLEMVSQYLNGMAKLFAVSEEVTQAEFFDYVSDVLDYPFVESAGWIKLMPQGDYSVEYLVEPNSNPVDSGKYHFENEGFRIDAFEEARLTGFISASDAYASRQKQLIDVFMVTVNSEGDDSGLVCLSLYPDALVEHLPADLNVHYDYFDVQLQQVGRSSLESKISDGFFESQVGEKRSLSYEYLDFFYGKVFSFSITPGSDFWIVHRQLDYVYALIIGLILTLIVSAFILLMSNRRFLLEKQVEKHVAHLKASEERFRSLFSNMMEGVAFNEMVYDEKGKAVNYRIEEVNDILESLMGLKRVKVIRKEADIVFGSKEPPLIEKYRTVVESGKAIVFETYFDFFDKYFQISVAPWGKSGFTTIFSDISERKQAEMRLKKSEERYRLISENAGDLIWLYDIVKEEFKYVSPSVKKLLGFSYVEMVGKNFKAVLTNISYDEIKHMIPLRIARFGIGDESMRIKKSRLDVITKNSGVLPMEVVTTLLLDEEGAVTGILGVCRDISDRLSAEEALRKSEEKYRLLVENQNDLIVKVDKEGYFLYVSPSYCQLFGKSEEELLNEMFLPLVHPDDRETTARAMEKLSSPPYQVVLEQRAMTRDGWKWLSWSDTALLDEDGNINEIIGVGRDISDRKMAENALQESRQLLELQNEEYAALNEEYLTMNEELTSINEDLSVAIERAEESEKLKTAFLQNMSHEIRTPLNAVIGFSEMLGTDYLTTEDRNNYTTIIINSSRQLLELVNDILTISAIETRQDKINITSVNINHLLSELYTVFRSKARDKGLEIKVYKLLPDDKAVLMTDELKLRQILVNLIGNALKFTKEGMIEFGYEIINVSTFRFFVKDTGTGISMAMQYRVFERFMQADHSIKGNFGGTGLGLAICKGHVEMFGGEIWVESTPGVGSVFYFTIPVFGLNNILS